MRCLLLILTLPVILLCQDLQGFLDKLSYQESRGSYTAIGGKGGKYIGKYQFSNNVLKQVGYGNVTVSKFAANKKVFPPSAQEEAMRLLLKKYETYLQNEINKYSETYFKGKYVTKAGLLAACHGVGYPEVIKYFKGTSSKPSTIEKYLRQFSEYSIS